MATTASGFWYPTAEDAYSASTLLATAMSSVESKVGPHIADTKWIDLPVLTGSNIAGSGGHIKYRKIGQQVHFSMAVYSDASAYGTTYHDICTLPENARPFMTMFAGNVAVGPTTRTTSNARLRIATTGVVSVLNMDANANSFYTFCTFAVG